MVSPAPASAPSPSVRSSMSSSVGAASPGKSISGLVVLGSNPMGGPFGGVGRDSVRGEDVDDEHEGVRAADLGRAAGGAVAVRRRDDEQHAAADGLADELVVPRLDDVLLADH